MGIDPLTVTWTTPTTISVSVDRLRADALVFSDEGTGLSQCSLGQNIALALMTSVGECRVVRGDQLTDLVVHDVVSLTRLAPAGLRSPEEHPPIEAEAEDAFLRAVDTPEGVPAVALHPSTHRHTLVPHLVAVPTFATPREDPSGESESVGLLKVLDQGLAALPDIAPARPQTWDDETSIRELSTPAWVETPDDATIMKAPVIASAFTSTPPPFAFDDATIVSTSAEHAALSALAAANANSSVNAIPTAQQIFPTHMAPQQPEPAPVVTIADSRGSLTYPLADSLYVGRAPMAPADAPSDAQALAVVESPSESVSATHLRVRRQGEQVLVWDMWSTNGTTVIPPATPPFRLGSGEELAVAPGTWLDLGDSVHVSIGGTRVP